MDETSMLVLLALFMLVGSYLAGSIPLLVPMSDGKLKIVSVFSAGLLVGTALTVIIPEGICAVYSNVLSIAHIIVVIQQHIALNTVSSKASPLQHHDPDYSKMEPTAYSTTIGLSLVLGFVFMMLVDQISTRRSEAMPSKSDRNMSLIIGLVVHAAADGVALGAAATISHKDIEIFVFLAIMLHKVPSAFGIVTFLLKEGYGRKRIRMTLAIFSMVAPIVSLITYFGIGAEQKEMLNSVNATGIVMLFSAGTFLYVATVKILPELTSCGQQSNAEDSYDYLEAPLTQVRTRYKSLKNGEFALLIIGALLPLLLRV